MEDHPALQSLAPDEEIHVQATAGESVVIVTDRRLAVASPERLALDVPIDKSATHPIRYRARSSGDPRRGS
jgi:hypothetical protein